MHTKQAWLIAQIKDLSWGYTPQKRLFQNFDLSIKERDFMILQGRSGTGKSTLVNMLTGYLRPPTKSIYYRYEDIAKMSPSELQEYRRQIGIIFQDTKIISNLSIRDNIMYPLKVYGHDDEDVIRRYNHFIQLIELEERADAPVQELSWGEKQKVAIARALMHNPSFVIADEPTGNLDDLSSFIIADLLLAIHELGNTILLITHDQSLINYLTTKQPSIISHKLV